MANIYQAHGELWICVTNIKVHEKLWLFILNPWHLYISYHVINSWNLYKNPLSLFVLYHNIHNVYFQNSWLVGRYSHEKLTPIDLTDLTSKGHRSSPSPPLSDVDPVRFVENRCDLDEIRWDLASSQLDPAKSRPKTSRFGQISTKVAAPSVLTETDHCPTKLKPTPLVVFGS